MQPIHELLASTHSIAVPAVLADLTLSPGGIISWIGVGLVAGWMAGLLMSGRGYGILADIALGLVGAVIGGFLAGFLIQGEAGFWASLLIAFIGAAMLIAIVRILSPGRATRV